MNHKIALVIPYYGRRPVYLPVWLLCAGHNPSLDFLLVTDLPWPKPLPKNVKHIHMPFEELRARTQALFDFEVSLESAYKLCDFKPAFGLIFADLLTGYDFWGHCDLDLVFGCVESFLGDALLRHYERVQYKGHFALYKNCPKMNTLFMREGALFGYKTVFSKPEHDAFDEETGMTQIALRQNVPLWAARCMAEVSVKHRARVRLNRAKNYPIQAF
jgi:hypothetical protein